MIVWVIIEIHCIIAPATSVSVNAAEMNGKVSR